MTSFALLAQRVISEGALEPLGITPEFVLEQWLKSRYREVVNELSFANINRVETVALITSAVQRGVASFTSGSDHVVGSGFLPAHAGWFIRAGNDNEWYRVEEVLSASEIAIDTAYANASKAGTNYLLTQRYYGIPAIRWLFDIRLPRRAYILQEASQAKLDEMFPNRIWAPGIPQWWSPHGWTASGDERVVEIYPISDQTYRLEATGYASIVEPLLNTAPHSDIDDRILIEGGLADAFNYRASLEADDIVRVRSFMDLSTRHQNRFSDLLERQRRRDVIDAPPTRARLLIQRRETYGGGLYDPITTAEDEVWSRPPSIG